MYDKAEYKELTLAIFPLTNNLQKFRVQNKPLKHTSKTNICHVDYALFKADKASLVVAEITASEAFGK